MAGTDSTFIHEFVVGDKTFRIDALLVLSELTLVGADQEPTKEQLMAAVRSSIRPPEMAGGLTDAEALALALRVTFSLKSLGNVGAP
jgi:uncharacterized protein related to proFAR isomerase